jgi:hypothetical protein
MSLHGTFTTLGRHVWAVAGVARRIASISEAQANFLKIVLSLMRASPFYSSRQRTRTGHRLREGGIFSRAVSRVRLLSARFTQIKSLDTFDFAAQPSLIGAIARRFHRHPP